MLTQDTQKAKQEPSLEDKEARLKVLQNELAQSEASLEQNFAKWCAENLSAEDEELFFDDKEAFISMILARQNEFIMQELGEKSKIAKELEDEIGNQKAFSQVEEAQQRFLEANPEADMNALLEFFETDLPPRYKTQLEALSPDEFFTALYEIYKSYMQNGTQQPKEERQIPKQLEGVPSSADGGEESNLVMNRF